MPHHAGSSAQRIRIGLTGLAFAFLLVLLGSIVTRSSHDERHQCRAEATANEPSEPLAELGVAPGGVRRHDEQQRGEEEMTRARAARAPDFRRRCGCGYGACGAGMRARRAAAPRGRPANGRRCSCLPACR